MANFLLTSSRAPVTLELARNLARFNHKVVLADSLKFALATNSKWVYKNFLIGDPRSNIAEYKKSLIQIIQGEKIDVFIPTCEEVMYVSYLLGDLKKYCLVLTSEFSLLKQLHSKVEIMQLAEGMGIKTPQTHPFRCVTELPNKLPESYIVKPEFSRFGNKVLFNPPVKKLTKYLEREGQTCVLQEKIEGDEYCTYALALNGEVLASAMYQPVYRLGRSAGYYFKPAVNYKIEAFVSQFCRQLDYTGNVGFDIIVKNNEPYLIECNPRATSGLHLLWQENLADCILSEKKIEKPILFKPAHINMAMLLHGLPRALFRFQLKQWWKDFRSARNVIEQKDDNSVVLHMLKSIVELTTISIRKGISIRSAATRGIEWDGEDVI